MRPQLYDGLAWDLLPARLRGALPERKDDLARAHDIIRLGYPAAAPVLPHLMRWLQDPNWPVTGIIAPFLSQIGRPLLPEIRTVLRGDDEIWIYSVMAGLIGRMPDNLVDDLRDDLRSLAQRPSAEGIDLLANEILSRASASDGA